MDSAVPDRAPLPSTDDRTPPSGRSVQDHHRLTRRIVSGAFVVAIAIVGLAAAMLWRINQQQLNDGLTDLSALDLLVAAQTERTFDTASLVLDGISDDLQAAGIDSVAGLRQAMGDATSYHLLRAKIAGVPQIDSLTIVDAAGDVVNHTRSFPVSSVNLASSDFFLRLRDHPEIRHYVTPPVRGADDAWTLYVAKRLNAPNGAFVGVMLAAIRLKYFEGIYSEYLGAIAGDSKTIALWRSDGTLLARAPQELPGAPQNAAELSRPVPANGLGTFWDKDANGDVAVVQRRLENFPLTVELRQSARGILGQWSDASLATILGATALLSLVALAVWLLLRQLRVAAVANDERARADREAQARAEIQDAMTKAEAALRDAQHSEARFRDIVEVGSDWIWESDAQHRFTMVAGAKRPRRDVIGKTRWEQAGADPESDAVWREHKAQLDAHQPFRHFRFSVALAHGRFDVCVNGKPIFADDGSFLGYRGTVTDETELVAAREQAARADALLRNAIDSIAEGFVIYDADDRFVLCNDAYRKMYPQNAAGFVPGVPYEDIMREALATGRHPDAVGREEEWLAERLRKHREATEAEESRLADGRWVMRSERRMADGGVAGLRIDITALKQAQEALRHNQVMLNQAQRVAAVGSVLRHLKTDSVEWSDEMFHLFGLDRDVFNPGNTAAFLDHIHPDDRARLEQAIVENRRGVKVEPMQFRIVRPDGTTRWMLREVDIFHDGDGTPSEFLTTYKDVTDRVIAEKRQHELEALLSDAIGSISEGFVIYDADDRLVLCNDAYRAFYTKSGDILVPGTRFEDVLRTAVNDGLYVDARGREEEWLAARLNQHRVLDGAVETQLADGRWMLISERRTSSGGTAGLRIDITALKKAQESLHESEVMLNRAQRLSGTGSVVRNLKTGKTVWSDEMYRIFGLTHETFTPDTNVFFNFVHPDDRAIVENARSFTVNNEGAIQFRIVRPDGTIRWVYREVEYWREADGTAWARLATYKDITEQQAAQETLRERERMLSRAQRVSNTGSVMHDFRTKQSVWSDEMYRICGVTAETFIAGPQAFLTLVHPEDRAKAEQTVGRDETSFDSQPTEYRIIRPDGMVRWLHREGELCRDEDGSVVGRLSTFQDITALKIIQESLHEKEAMLALAQRVSATGSAVRDFRTGKTEWSDEMYRICGVTPENFTPGPEAAVALIHQDYRSAVIESIRNSEKGIPSPPLQYQINRTDGTSRWVISESEIMFDGDTPIGRVTTFRDVTEQYESEQRRHELEALLRDAIDSISEGFVIFDAEDRLALCNEAYRRLYPESSDLLVPGTRLEDILRAGLVHGRYAAARGREEEWLSEQLHKHRQPSGTVESQLDDGRWLLISERRTSSGGIAGLRVDITALKRVQQSLHESQQRLDRTQQIAHVGTVERNLQTREVIWSEETYRIFGVTPQTYDPTTNDLMKLIHPDDRGLLAEVIGRRVDEHKDTALKYRIIRPDGETRILRSEVDTVRDAAGQPYIISVAMMDITEHETANHRQLELETQLRHSEKLTALGTLAGGIAHDLNNTLVPIQALTKLAMKEASPDSQARTDLETVYQASLQARDLVRQILAFSRKQEIVPEPTNIGEKIREALNMLRASVPRTIELIEDIRPVAPIMADAGQLQQVVVNLVTNGAHAIGDAFGRVTVSLDEVADPSSKTGRMIRLSVTDTGCGMSEDVRHRIFEPFFTTKSVGEGTGLGLSVVHGIVTGQGGSIEVKSTPGTGSEFIIFLPAQAAPAEMAAVA